MAKSRRKLTRGRRPFAKCSHHGYGSTGCHRCQLANKLETMVKAGEVYITNKKTKKPIQWSKKEMLEEAKRLRGPQTHKKNVREGQVVSSANKSLADEID